MNKISKKLKYLLVSIFVFVAFSMLPNIYAVDHEVEADINNKDFVRFTLFSEPLDKVEKGWHDYGISNGSAQSYALRFIEFYKNKATNYEITGNSPESILTYDKYNYGYIKFLDDQGEYSNMDAVKNYFQNKTNFSSVYVKSTSANNDPNNVLIGGSRLETSSDPNANFRIAKTGAVKIDQNTFISFENMYLKSDYVKQLIKQNNIQKDSSGKYYNLYFSVVPVSTRIDPTNSYVPDTARSLGYDWDGNNRGAYFLWPTADQAVRLLYSDSIKTNGRAPNSMAEASLTYYSYFQPRTLGFQPRGEGPYDIQYFASGRPGSTGTSVFNYYDNILKVPSSIAGDKKVKVVYMQKDLGSNSYREVSQYPAVEGLINKEGNSLKLTVGGQTYTFSDKITLPSITNFNFAGISYLSEQTMPSVSRALSSSLTANNIQTLANTLINGYDNLQDNTCIVIKYNAVVPKNVKVYDVYLDGNGNQNKVLRSNENLYNNKTYTRKTNTGYQYVGVKQVTGSTNVDAAAGSGYNTTSVGVNATSDKRDTIIAFYYSNRNVTVEHKAGSSTLSRTSENIGLETSKTYSALGNPYYKNGNKYNPVSVTGAPNGYFTLNQTNKTLTVGALGGANKFVEPRNVTGLFTYELELPKEVYVRHLVKNSSGNWVVNNNLTNLSQTITAPSAKVVKNGYNHRYEVAGQSYNRTIPSGFNEFYKLDLSETLQVDKSRTILYEGKQYKYQGYKVGSGSTQSQAQNNRDAYKPNNSSTQAKVTTKSRYTYIDFYYEETIYTPDGKNPNDSTNSGLTPDLSFDPEKEDGTNIGESGKFDTNGCAITYVPAGEYIKPYLSTLTYSPYTLVYDLVGVGQTKVYNYDVYRLAGGTVSNATDNGDGINTEYFNSTQRYGVVNQNSNLNLRLSVDVNSMIRSSLDNFNRQNPMNIASIPSGSKTTKDSFGDRYKVNEDKYNGLREPVSSANYDIVRAVRNGAVDNNLSRVGSVTVNSRYNSKVNVYTPLVLGEIKIDSDSSVNHSNQGSNVIQKNTKFTLTPTIGTSGGNSGYTNITPQETEKYLDHYLVVLDFDIKLVNNNQIIKAGTVIRVNKGESITAIPTSGFGEDDENKTDTTSSVGNNIKVVGVTRNVAEGFEDKIKEMLTSNNSTLNNVVDKNSISRVTTSCETSVKKQPNKTFTEQGVTGNGTKMGDDAHYFVQKTHETISIGRIYDFKITDCLDVNYKNVFRETDATTGQVNKLTGITYFSGIRRLVVYGSGNNTLIERSGIDKVPSKTIVALGPYKHTQTNYSQAPKMGYRISYDLKTTGKYSGNGTRSIVITPRYYYISKDGQVFNDNIELYYKNSSGKYVKFNDSGYTIYFKPNDGYRFDYNKDEAGDITSMSNKLEPLKIGGSSFTLTDKMMSTSDDNFVQAWYGEFKLPNSTVALEKGSSDMNNALTNGYIGVVFDIKSVDKQNGTVVEVSYNQNNKSATPNENTSQWDYEGFMGFNNPGSALANNGLKMQLEKGIWTIRDNEMYQKIKGTVVLYDTDNRAANDFE